MKKLSIASFILVAALIGVSTEEVRAGFVPMQQPYRFTPPPQVSPIIIQPSNPIIIQPGNRPGLIERLRKEHEDKQVVWAECFTENGSSKVVRIPLKLVKASPNCVIVYN